METLSLTLLVLFVLWLVDQLSHLIIELLLKLSQAMRTFLVLLLIVLIAYLFLRSNLY